MSKRTNKKAAAKKPARKTPATKKLTKENAGKKTSPGKARKKAIAKKAAPKDSVRASNTWEVECSKDGILATGLSKAQAKQKSEEHQAVTGHLTTFIGSQ